MADQRQGKLTVAGSASADLADQSTADVAAGKSTCTVRATADVAGKGCPRQHSEPESGSSVEVQRLVAEHGSRKAVIEVSPLEEFGCSRSVTGN